MLRVHVCNSLGSPRGAGVFFFLFFEAVDHRAIVYTCPGRLHCQSTQFVQPQQQPTRKRKKKGGGEWRVSSPRPVGRLLSCGQAGWACVVVELSNVGG